MQITKSHVDHYNVSTHETTKTSTIKVNGVDIAYRSFGKQNEVPIVFLQHFTGTMDNWDPAITNALSKKHQVILFDNNGVGSSGGKTPESVSQMAEDAIAFIERLGLTKVDLLGFSLGGFVAQEIALSHPNLVRNIVLAGTGPRGGEGISNLNVVVSEAAKKGVNDIMLNLFFSSTNASREAGRDFLSRLKQRIENRDALISIEATESQAKAIVAFGNDKGNNLEKLSKLFQPVLVFNGNDDIMVPSINSFTLVQHLPNAKLIMWSNSGHGGIFQYHSDFVKEVDAFLTFN